MKIFVLLFFIIVTFPPVELEKRSLLDDKIELLVPKTFKVMTKEMLGRKYPIVYINYEKRPALLLTDDSATVWLAVNFSRSSIKVDFESQAMVLEKNAFKMGFPQAFPSAVLIEDGIKVINGKTVGYVKFITDASGPKVYNYFFMAYFHKRDMVTCSFSCSENLMTKWEETAEQIVNSLKVK